MEASAKQHRASRNRLSFEDSHAVSKRFSYSRQDDVLSLNSWSDCEKSDTSGSPSRDPDPGLDGSCSSYSKEHRSYNLDHRQPHHLNAKRIGSTSTQNIPSNTVTVPRSRPIPNNTNQDATVTSASVRSRSSSNIERGPYYGRSLGTQKCVYDHAMCPSTYGSINYEHDIIDQPANPFQDFSYLGFPSHDSTKTKKDLPKEKLNVKTSSNLYPVLKDLEHRPISNGSRSSYPDAQARGSFTFLGDLDDGPVSLPVASSPSNLEQNTPFRSLPASVSLTDKSGLSSHTRSIPPSQDSQRGKKSNKDSQTKGPWSIWKLHQSQPILSKAPSLKRQPKSSSDLEALRESFEHRLEHDNVKTKVLSAWNNFKYGWMFNTKPTLKYDSPLFMLGKCYHMRKEDSDSETADEFLKDFTSRIWMTYRSNFYPIPGTKLNTDCGWGCMLRSAQMLIIQCLVTHYLGREWRIHNPQTETEHAYYREIIRWFSDPVDAPSDIMPFSLHHLVSFGRHYHKEPGEWFGPSSAAYIFRDAFARASQTLPILSQLCIYVAQDCTVYMEDVLRLCTAREKSESLSNSGEAESSRHDHGKEETWLRSLIILIPMRLGGEVMNEIYVPCVKNLLTQESCMGIIGGKPKHSLYFIGWQDNKLIHLDPHYCREAVDTSDKNFKIETYHCMTPKKLSITRMDPSCTVGFYIRDATEFKKFVQEVREYVFPEKQRGAYPLFIFAEGSHDESSQHAIHTGQDKGRVKVTHYQIHKNGQKQRTYSRDSEDFIIL